MFSEAEVREALESLMQSGWDKARDGLQSELMRLYQGNHGDYVAVSLTVAYLLEQLQPSEDGYSVEDIRMAGRAFQRTYADEKDLAFEWAEEHWDGFNEEASQFFDYEAFGKYLLSDSPALFITDTDDTHQIGCFWQPDNIPSEV
ncbi:hypothetical protein [Streptomyces sp. NPDC018584]|uniref:hypothetical protein n=1 Tax=unclassified Streptomyces TaxID=2593676 RepID=UPI0037879A28